MNVYISIKEIDDVYVTDEFKNKDLVTVADLIDKISELASEVERLEDELKEAKRDYEDLEQDLEDNYRPIPLKELYGVSDRDFI